MIYKEGQRITPETIIAVQTDNKTGELKGLWLHADTIEERSNHGHMGPDIYNYVSVDSRGYVGSEKETNLVEGQLAKNAVIILAKHMIDFS